MKVQVVQRLEHMRRGHYHQKTLPTEMVVGDGTPIEPHHYTIMRFKTRTDRFLGPEGEIWTYDELLHHHLDNEVKFPGTSHFLEAMDIEYWEDGGTDGHIEWIHVSNYRIFLHPETEEEENFYGWIQAQTGGMLQRLLEEAVYEIERDARNR